MRISRIFTAGALAVALTLAGCGNGHEPEPDTDTTSAPEVEDSPELDDPELDDSSDDAAESDDLSEEYSSAAEGDAAEVDVPEGSVSSGIDADAHPFCAVLAKYEDVDDIEGTPTEDDIAQITQMRDDAVKNAPKGIEDQVEIYFDTVLDMAEDSVSSGQAPDIQLDELGEDFQEAFGAIFGFAFETCLDIDLEIESN